MNAIVKPDQKYRTCLRYPGGKARAVRILYKHLPDSFSRYREPCVGGASMMLHIRSKRPDLEGSDFWINDTYRLLVSFWRTVRDQNQELVEELLALRESLADPEAVRAYYKQVKGELTNDPFREAVLMFFFNRVTFSGTTEMGGFSKASAGAGKKGRFHDKQIRKILTLADAFKDVIITNHDALAVIRADGRDVFMFLDPPYTNTGGLYKHNKFNHDALADTLKQTKHKFLLTYDDSEKVRNLYKWANIQPFQLFYGSTNVGKPDTTMGKELIIKNY